MIGKRYINGNKDSNLSSRPFACHPHSHHIRRRCPLEVVVDVDDGEISLPSWQYWPRFSLQLALISVAGVRTFAASEVEAVARFEGHNY